MTRRRAAVLASLALAAAAAGTSPFWAPPVLRNVAWFAAERVEVSGTRLLAPHEVLAASGARVGANVWTDPEAWEAALRRHPVIADAEITRRLPRGLRIRIVEKRPAALVQTGTLRPATADGQVLPVDPTRVPLDLPIVSGRVKADAGGRITDAKTRALLAETARLLDLDPVLMARVSEVRSEKDGTRLVMASPAAEVVLPPAAGEDRLVRLRAALDDLGRRLAAASDSTGTRRARVDARFVDQIVVKM